MSLDMNYLTNQSSSERFYSSPGSPLERFYTPEVSSSALKVEEKTTAVALDSIRNSDAEPVDNHDVSKTSNNLLEEFTGNDVKEYRSLSSQTVEFMQKRIGKSEKDSGISSSDKSTSLEEELDSSSNVISEKPNFNVDDAVGFFNLFRSLSDYVAENKKEKDSAISSSDKSTSLEEELDSLSSESSKDSQSESDTSDNTYAGAAASSAQAPSVPLALPVANALPASNGKSKQFSAKPTALPASVSNNPIVFPSVKKDVKATVQIEIGHFAKNWNGSSEIYNQKRQNHILKKETGRRDIQLLLEKAVNDAIKKQPENFSQRKFKERVLESQNSSGSFQFSVNCGLHQYKPSDQCAHITVAPFGQDRRFFHLYFKNKGDDWVYDRVTFRE